MKEISVNTLAIEAFEYRTLPAALGVDINVAIGGSGPALVLLHGFHRPTTCGATSPSNSSTGTP